MSEMTADLDPYALDYPVCNIEDKRKGRMERFGLIFVFYFFKF